MWGGGGGGEGLGQTVLSTIGTVHSMGGGVDIFGVVCIY